MVTLEDMLNEMSPEQRRRVAARTEILLAEHDSLTQLRQALERTQASLGERLGTNAEDISRLEQPSDLLLSTLSGFVAEGGGKLSIVVEYPDQSPVALTDIRAFEDDYHDPDDADFELSTLPKGWAAPDEEDSEQDES